MESHGLRLGGADFPLIFPEGGESKGKALDLPILRSDGH